MKRTLGRQRVSLTLLSNKKSIKSCANKIEPLSNLVVNIVGREIIGGPHISDSSYVIRLQVFIGEVVASGSNSEVSSTAWLLQQFFMVSCYYVILSSRPLDQISLLNI